MTPPDATVNAPAAPPKMRLAVVGVSQNSEKYGHRLFVDLLQVGYQVWGVHPNGGEVAGQILYPHLDQLPAVPDMVITVVPPAVTLQIVEQCIKLGVPQIWMQPGSESAAAVAAAKQAGIQVIEQACFMKEQGVW